MSPYKLLIVAVTLMLVGGAGYYFHAAGVPDLVTQDIRNGGNGKSYGTSAIEVYSGVYECTANTGCTNTTRLVLGQDTTLDVIATIDGQDASYGQGSWGIGANGSLIFLLNTTGSAPEGSPLSFIAKKVSTLRISNLYAKKGIYPDMKDPVFTRINPESQTTSGDN